MDEYINKTKILLDEIYNTIIDEINNKKFEANKDNEKCSDNEKKIGNQITQSNENSENSNVSKM